uniref:Uncharacterized protein n=1 Tax=Glossina pallidipes TaxID=7398 RepID=A0A1A9ZC54_GLOPL
MNSINDSMKTLAQKTQVPENLKIEIEPNKAEANGRSGKTKRALSNGVVSKTLSFSNVRWKSNAVMAADCEDKPVQTGAVIELLDEQTLKLAILFQLGYNTSSLCQDKNF